MPRKCALPEQYIDQLIKGILNSIAKNVKPIAPGKLAEFIAKDTVGEKVELCYSQANNFVSRAFKRRLDKINALAWDYMVGKRKLPKPPASKSPPLPPSDITNTHQQNHPTIISNSHQATTYLKSSKKRRDFTPIYQNTRGKKQKIKCNNTSSDNHHSSLTDPHASDIPAPLAKVMNSRVYKNFLKDNPHVLQNVINVCDHKALYPSHSPTEPNSKGVCLSVEAPFKTNHCMNNQRIARLSQHHGKDLPLDKLNNHTNETNGTAYRYTYATGSGSQTTGTANWYVLCPMFMIDMFRLPIYF